MKLNFIPKIINVVIVVIMVTSVFMQQASAVSLADPVDQFSVTSPGPNSLVSGIVNTIWKVSDDEQTSIPYELNLLDTNTCSTRITTISSGNVTSSNNTITTSWNSAGSFPQAARLNDGKYCMQLCVSLRNGNTPYSACNGRIITIRNTNRSPIITTAPPAGRQIASTGSFSYDVNAYDPDGDPISYLLVSNPGFVSINPANGLITTNAGNKPAGNYTITLQVRDSLGATAQQSFDLSITSTTPPTTTPTTAEPSPTPSVKITSPIANEVFVGKTNQVKWEVSNGATVSEIVLLFAKDGGEWQELTKLGADATSFLWDVSDLEDGQYSLQILLKTTDGKEFRQNSDPFTVKNTIDPNDLITKPLIVDVLPSDGASIRDRRPLISGKFTPPIDGTIDVTKFKFFFNDQDRTDLCAVTPAEFKCTLDANLELGVHKVSVEVEDFKQQKAQKEWNFTIIEDGTITSQPADAQGEGVFIGDRFIPRESLVWGLLICCGALILLLIPWILFSIWRRREENETRTEVTINQDPYAPILPDISYTAPEQAAAPEVKVNYYYPDQTVAPAPEPWLPTVTVNTEIQPEPAQDMVEANPVEVIETKSETPEPEIQKVEVNIPEPEVTVNSDPLAPAQEVTEVKTNVEVKPTEVMVKDSPSTDPLAPATNQPDWLNAGPVTTTTTVETKKDNEPLTSYGYGSKID